jgi:hypothetical protein
LSPPGPFTQPTIIIVSKLIDGMIKINDSQPVTFKSCNLLIVRQNSEYTNTTKIREPIGSEADSTLALYTSKEMLDFT